MPAWPSTVPQTALAGSLTDRPERNVASFQPDVGDPIERPRSSLARSMISFETFMTSAQFDLLLTFYNTTVTQGVLSFTRKHPRDINGADRTFKFTAPPEFSGDGYVNGRARIALRQVS